MLQKPTTHVDCAFKKDVIRGSIFTALVVEKKTNDTVRYFVFDSVDFKGKVPKVIIRKVSKVFASAIHKMLKDSVKNSTYDQDLLSNNGTLEAMQHENHLRNKFSQDLPFIELEE